MFYGIRSEGERLEAVVLCEPRREYFCCDDRVRHNITSEAQPERALAQHNALVQLLRGRGACVLLIDELPAHPNSVFTRDTSVVTPGGYIKLRMGIQSRSGEEEWAAAYLDILGVSRAGEIFAPGTVEGGDVLLAGNVAFLGRSRRTNKEGQGQMGCLLEGMGYEVRCAEVPEPFLHLGGAMTVISPRHVLACSEIFSAAFFEGFEVIETKGRSFISGNVIALGAGEVIAESSNVDGCSLLKKAGFTVHECDLSEFVKGTGGPSCLILPIGRSAE